MQTGCALRISGENGCLDERGELAFAFTGQGQITAYELKNMLPLSNPVLTAQSMLMASPDRHPTHICGEAKRQTPTVKNDFLIIF